jgi:EAL domain-containing protein (putative c-di-GMP-specific phosphodiesterase class I)
VAEGIETVEQAELMKSLGCGKGQGYLYSRPMSAQELKRWAVSVNRDPALRT